MISDIALSTLIKQSSRSIYFRNDNRRNILFPFALRLSFCRPPKIPGTFNHSKQSTFLRVARFQKIRERIRNATVRYAETVALIRRVKFSRVIFIVIYFNPLFDCYLKFYQVYKSRLADPTITRLVSTRSIVKQITRMLRDVTLFKFLPTCLSVQPRVYSVCSLVTECSRGCHERRIYSLNIKNSRRHLLFIYTAAGTTFPE